MSKIYGFRDTKVYNFIKSGGNVHILVRILCENEISIDSSNYNFLQNIFFFLLLLD